MKKPALLLALCIAGAGVAVAQNPPPESVTVTGTKSREVMRGFVDSTAAPTHLLGKIARCETPICPYAVGVKQAAADFVVARVKEVAEKVGAPVSTDAKCTFNAEIVFTKTPQALLDDMKKSQPTLLGYHSSSDEREWAQMRQKGQIFAPDGSVVEAAAASKRCIGGNISVSDNKQYQGANFIPAQVSSFVYCR
jgi:hypothetical protein